MPTYNKLVRDLIPQIIEHDGKSCDTYTLDDAQYITELNKKMHEELAEYEEAETTEEVVEELADLMELLYAAVKFHGVSIDELETVRAEKAVKRGSFDERIFLVDVHDD